jgi:hypothetical protein
LQARGSDVACSGDPKVGEFGDVRVLKTFGQVPDDLSAL